MVEKFRDLKVAGLAQTVRGARVKKVLIASRVLRAIWVFRAIRVSEDLML
jgi:hypothetical protein